ncbi:MAG: signal peptide peptidase SppA [Sphaerospermopsis sp. SIO1G1]|nr:signal peptide peptidase SppA [Sphaerospermopsis sp. SIO1G1]
MTNFIKQTIASLIGSLLGLTIFAGAGTLGLLFLVIAAATSSDTSPQVKNKSMLVFDLSVKITDSQPDSSELLQKALTGASQEAITLRQVLENIEKAQRDSRIVGIYIDASKPSTSSSLGYASLREIRRALDEFRKSGKKIIAYGQNWNERQYYLSSVADEIILNPIGSMEMNGLSSQPIFLTGALEKYGIGVQVIRVGKFKGAVETFTLDKLSPENRQQTQKVLDDIWREWRTSVAKSRKIQPQKIQTIANNQAILAANTAKTNGLIDKVAYQDQVIADLKKLTNKDKDDKNFQQIDITDYVEVSGKSMGVARNSENKIAVVYAEGEIVSGRGDEGEIGGDRFANIFSKIRQNDDIKSVVLRINSPGGSATASEIMQREIKLTQQVKPVIVSMGDIAASGGYWIASDSNRIFAEPNTITGSIGVFGILFNGQKLGNDNGITWDTVKTAKFADTQTVARPKSPQELAIYQRTVNRIYNLFLNKVAKGRKLSQQKVAEIAQGRIWSGIAAKQIGLVDEIGGLDAAIEYAAKAAKLGNDWEVQEYPKVTTLEERLFGRKIREIQARLGMEHKALQPNTPLLIEFNKLQQELAILTTMNDPQGLYARLPFNLTID